MGDPLTGTTTGGVQLPDSPSLPAKPAKKVAKGDKWQVKSDKSQVFVMKLLMQGVKFADSEALSDAFELVPSQLKVNKLVGNVKTNPFQAVVNIPVRTEGPVITLQDVKAIKKAGGAVTLPLKLLRGLVDAEIIGPKWTTYVPEGVQRAADGITEQGKLLATGIAVATIVRELQSENPKHSVWMKAAANLASVGAKRLGFSNLSVALKMVSLSIGLASVWSGAKPGEAPARLDIDPAVLGKTRAEIFTLFGTQFAQIKQSIAGVTDVEKRELLMADFAKQEKKLHNLWLHSVYTDAEGGGVDPLKLKSLMSEYSREFLPELEAKGIPNISELKAPVGKMLDRIETMVSTAEQLAYRKTAVRVFCQAQFEEIESRIGQMQNSGVKRAMWMRQKRFLKELDRVFDQKGLEDFMAQYQEGFLNTVELTSRMDVSELRSAATAMLVLLQEADKPVKVKETDAAVTEKSSREQVRALFDQQFTLFRNALSVVTPDDYRQDLEGFVIPQVAHFEHLLLSAKDDYQLQEILKEYTGTFLPMVAGVALVRSEEVMTPANSLLFSINESVNNNLAHLTRNLIDGQFTTMDLYMGAVEPQLDREVIQSELEVQKARFHERLAAAKNESQLQEVFRDYVETFLPLMGDEAVSEFAPPAKGLLSQVDERVKAFEVREVAASQALDVAEKEAADHLKVVSNWLTERARTATGGRKMEFVTFAEKMKAELEDFQGQIKDYRAALWSATTTAEKAGDPIRSLSTLEQRQALDYVEQLTSPDALKLMKSCVEVIVSESS